MDNYIWTLVITMAVLTMLMLVWVEVCDSKYKKHVMNLINKIKNKCNIRRYKK